MKLFLPHRYFNRPENRLDTLTNRAKKPGIGPVFKDVKKRKFKPARRVNPTLHTPSSRVGDTEARKRRATPPNWKLKRERAAMKGVHNLQLATVARFSKKKCTCFSENRNGIIRVVVEDCKLHQRLRIW